MLSRRVIMGVAVCAMHYTGMARMPVHLNADSGGRHRLQRWQLLVPILLFVLIVVIALGYAMLNRRRPRRPGRDRRHIDRPTPAHAGPRRSGQPSQGVDEPAHGLARFQRSASAISAVGVGGAAGRGVERARDVARDRDDLGAAAR